MFPLGNMMFIPGQQKEAGALSRPADTRHAST